ncbi:MAG: 2-oxoglutarate and iron-dependent oxygenase domain-containing protein [Pseudomonadota bacterium]
MNQSLSSQIPVIDVAPLVRGEDCLKTAIALRQASQDPGFIYIRHHGIPNAVIEQARISAMEFFRLPEAVKSTVTVSQHHRGWLSAGRAQMADDTPADLKESFIWGNPHDAALSDHSLRGPNQWPAQHVQQLHQHASDWFAHAQQLAYCLLRGFAIALELDRNFFLRQSDKPLSRASFVYYPQRPSPPETQIERSQFGVGPHTDFGVLTILCQDQIGGLQIENTDGQWIEAPPINDTLIVNVGDLLSRWTNGAFRSAPHRVISPSGRDRLSLVLAFDPNPETLVDARATYPDTTDCADPITCGDYLDWRFARAFDYRASPPGEVRSSS